jgi:hypothetical protein
MMVFLDSKIDEGRERIKREKFIVSDRVFRFRRVLGVGLVAEASSRRFRPPSDPGLSN